MGISALAMNRCREVFGDDVGVFRPEWWLGDEKRVKYMDGLLATVLIPLFLFSPLVVFGDVRFNGPFLPSTDWRSTSGPYFSYCLYSIPLFLLLFIFNSPVSLIVYVPSPYYICFSIQCVHIHLNIINSSSSEWVLEHVSGKTSRWSN